MPFFMVNKFEDTKGETRDRNSKDKQYNGQNKKKYTKTINGRQNITSETTDWTTANTQ